MYHLTRQPEVLDQLRLEIQAAATTDPDHLARLPFLEAICLETLRIHTPAPLASRVLRRPLQLGPYLLPAGMGVGVAMSITHFDEARFPDPFAWQPSRFMDRQYGPFEFFPFGGGARRCLGAAFALYEMKLVLASLIMSYELLSADRRPPRTRRRNLVLGPDTRVLMRMKPRARA
jgi:cytochrome P450